MFLLASRNHLFALESDTAMVQYFQIPSSVYRWLSLARQLPPSECKRTTEAPISGRLFVLLLAFYALFAWLQLGWPRNQNCLYIPFTRRRVTAAMCWGSSHRTPLPPPPPLPWSGTFSSDCFTSGGQVVKQLEASGLYVCINVCMYVCMYVCIYVSMWDVSMYISMYVCMHLLGM